MEIVTLEEMLDSLKENAEAELESAGLESWTISSAGVNFAENFSLYTLEDLKDLQTEIREGAKVEVTIDLSEEVLEYLTQQIEEQEDDEIYDDDDNWDGLTEQEDY